MHISEKLLSAPRFVHSKYLCLANMVWMHNTMHCLLCSVGQLPNNVQSKSYMWGSNGTKTACVGRSPECVSITSVQVLLGTQF